MSKKLKILGVALAAALVVSSLAVLNASAKVAGHFTSDAAHTLLVGSEGHSGTEVHTTEFHIDQGNGIVCDVAKYSGTTSVATTTEVTVFPSYEKCHTTGSETIIPITLNGCHYTFFSAGANAHGTVAVNCPGGGAIEIHHPNCTITVGAQSPTTEHMTQGVAYTTKSNPTTGKHELTVDATLKGITAQYHGGVCIFLGTSHTGEMTGSVTLQGTNTEGQQVNVTHT
jgi:hypothetical protein